MARLEKFINPSAVIQRIPVAPQALAWALACVMWMVAGYMWSPAMFVAMAGVLGAAAGFLPHRPTDEPNPYISLEPVFSCPRYLVIPAIGGVALAVAIYLFFQGIAPVPGELKQAGYYLALANGLLFFGAFFIVLGHFRLSEAQSRLHAASNMQTLEWRKDARGLGVHVEERSN